MYLDSGFQLSRANGSRIIEKGCGCTFQLHHALLSYKIINKFRLPNNILNFSFLSPMAPELRKKGMAVLLNYAKQSQGTLRN